ncbi:hypothetical protein, partial [Mycobacterium sp.]|uniref:hypothetical protein n=1 Tax=Mycobacterium sp. TaxID=1785 RepID=UPI003A847276
PVDAAEPVDAVATADAVATVATVARAARPAPEGAAVLAGLPAPEEHRANPANQGGQDNPTSSPESWVRGSAGQRHGGS